VSTLSLDAVQTADMLTTWQTLESEDFNDVVLIHCPPYCQQACMTVGNLKRTDTRVQEHTDAVYSANSWWLCSYCAVL